MNPYNYNNLTPFKWCILQNFPFIEADFDAITEYQLLCKVVEYLNNTINSMNNVGQQMENVTNAMTQLQNYVNNYFDNLDVQDEINNKLNEMAEDGTLTLLIKNYVDPFIAEQNQTIANNNTAQNARITYIDGKVDAISSGNPIPVSSINDMTDTTKVYVNTTNGHLYWYNGTEWTDFGTYESTELGNKSVHYNNLEELLQGAFNLETTEQSVELALQGFYIVGTGAFQSIASNSYGYSQKINVLPHELYKVTGRAQNQCCLIVLYDENDDVITTIPNTVSQEAQQYTNYLLEIPSNCYKMAFSCLSPSGFRLSKVTSMTPKVEKLKSNIVGYTNLKQELKDTLDETYTTLQPTINEGGFYVVGTGALQEYNQEYHYTGKISVIPGEKYKLSGRSNNRVAFIVLYDNNQNVTQTIPASQSENTIWTDYEFTIPENCYYMALSSYVYNVANEIVIKKATGYIPKLNSENIMNIVNNNKILKGKKGLCLGDSITNFGNYPEVMSNYTGCQFVNGGIGGTTLSTVWVSVLSFTSIVTALISGDWTDIDDYVANHQLDARIAPAIARLKQVDVTELDYLTIAYGTNDWKAYSNSSLDNPNDEFDVSKLGGALRKGIKDLLTANPKLLIYVFTPAYRNSTGSPDTDKNPNENGIYLADFCEDLEGVANGIHVPCKNMSKYGMVNAYNYEEWLNDGTHRTTAGYELLGEQYAKFILSN